MIDNNFESILVRTAEYNTMDKTLLKVAEECNELAEVMIKRVIKQEKYRPPIEKLTEEMGDVLFRVLVAAKALGNEEQVKQRVADKSKQVNEWIDSQMFKGGV